MQNQASKDLDAIAARLKTRHEALERALTAALARAGLRREAIAKLAGLATRVDAEQFDAERRRIEAAPAAAGVSWEELCRPSLESLGNLRSLRRA